MGSDATREITIPIRRVKLLLTLLLSALFVSGSFWVLLVAGPRTPIPFIITTIPLIGSVLFITPLVILLIPKLLDRRPGLSIDSKGFVDNASRFPAGRLRWPEIASLGTSSTLGERFIIVTLKDAGRERLGRNLFRRLTQKMNARIYGGEILIPLTILRVRQDELYRLMCEAFEMQKGLTAPDPDDLETKEEKGTPLTPPGECPR